MAVRESDGGRASQGSQVRVPRTAVACCEAGHARTVAEMKPSRDGPRRRNLPGSPFNVPVVEEPAEAYEQHDLVTHDKYGLGSVLRVEDQSAVVVDFGNHQVRIVLPCARLFKL